MNVVLLQDVKPLGFTGDVIFVKKGYGRNFLIPNGFATEANPLEIKRAEKIKAERIASHEEIVKNADAISKKLDGKVVILSGKVSKENKLFGGFSKENIAEAIEEQEKVKIDKSNIHLKGGHIKTLGEHAVDVHLYEGKHVTIRIRVKKET
jgi:large subunit ribosomal protein L9